MPISTKIKHNHHNICGPDGTVFIDLDRKVFCCLDKFVESVLDDLSYDIPMCIYGYYHQFYTFTYALITIAKIVDNQTQTNKNTAKEEYEKQWGNLRFHLTRDEIEQELVKDDKESRIVHTQKESYLDLFNRYQSCLQTKSSGNIDQQLSHGDELSEPPKKRQRIC